MTLRRGIIVFFTVEIRHSRTAARGKNRLAPPVYPSSFAEVTPATLAPACLSNFTDILTYCDGNISQVLVPLRQGQPVHF